ncbi:UPF0669 protein [Trichoplax sp. H2]|uniref:Uncharacterized protein n=1 Tax=Trichoplax adhaerens TaxID=10228 RepID=B3RZ19_TRIAD|nr:hypothetical protein TRIADDRAFT_57296 [Trichoplax adhaerens]EDV24125.1 hypothetical protein TRIADDRAFT_57296 [Trichoplax adhaerens]RDD37267.1 UPF0669 protein [Trichoplax sp. H2]|eukprot:XP_002113651.1 hypothetical protein TRIADDRAFT_57296 [Trichoplax adhaerens]
MTWSFRQNCRSNLAMAFMTMFFLSMAIVRTVDANGNVKVFDGAIGRGNYTYYTITKGGTYTLILDSISGDADIYADEGNEKPDFDHYSHVSNTCGRDIITISSSAKRPIGVAIYGHVSYEQSVYQLTVVMGEKDDAINAAAEKYNSNKHGSASDTFHRIFVTLLKILFELL